MGIWLNQKLTIGLQNIRVITRVEANLGFAPHTWMISIPATLLLLTLILKKGASLGVTALWVVVSVLTISLVMFFFGSTENSGGALDIFNTVQNTDDFFIVFAIIFPAF